MSSFAIRLVFSVVLILCVPAVAFAQSAPSSATPPEVVGGGYVVHQSIDFGVRISDTTGSMDMYDTLVNLHTGPRVLDQSLSLRSENHQGILFDNLLVHSIGWGGDPNNYLRLAPTRTGGTTSAPASAGTRISSTTTWPSIR